MIKMIKFVKPALIIAGILFGAAHLQAQKLAHIDFSELVKSMPEYKSALAEIEKMNNELEKELEEMQKEFQDKYARFEREAQQLTELVRQRRVRELQDMQGKIQGFMEENQMGLQRRQQELIQPITEKAQKAIDEVAAKNNYTYVFDASQGAGLLYTKAGEDILPAVKKHLGIDAKPAAASDKK